MLLMMEFRSIMMLLVALHLQPTCHAQYTSASSDGRRGSAGPREESLGSLPVSESGPSARQPDGAPPLFVGVAEAQGNRGVAGSDGESLSQPAVFLGGSPGGFPGGYQNRYGQPQTVTEYRYVTLTDVALHTVPVTVTQLVVHTTTRAVDQVVTTPVNEHVALSTSLVVQPEFVTATETKSDFRMVTVTSLTFFTQTHTSYAIRHSTFTTTATQIVSITSAMVRTIVSTQRDVTTDLHTVFNTVYVRGNYYGGA